VRLGPNEARFLGISAGFTVRECCALLVAASTKIVKET
jgi:hypothetical protein